jgi:hypothetical protein
MVLLTYLLLPPIPAKLDRDLSASRHPTIDANQLSNGLPPITPALGTTLAEAIAICLSEQNHPSGSTLGIEGDFQAQVQVCYPTITAQMLRCWNDE